MISLQASPFCCKTCRKLRYFDSVPTCTPQGDLSAYTHRLFDFRCEAYLQDNQTERGERQFIWLRFLYGK